MHNENQILSICTNCMLLVFQLPIYQCNCAADALLVRVLYFFCRCLTLGCVWLKSDQSDDIIIELALSMAEFSSDARYICVVLSESCPIASLITTMGIPRAFAADAQLCRAQ